MTSIYLAGPLFTAAEIHFNHDLYLKLASLGYHVFLPQEECKNKSLEDIFNTCRSGIDSSTIVVAILDGTDADSGTSWECGYAYAKKIPVIAVRTDFRLSADTKGFNTMLYYSATAVINSPYDYQDQLFKILKTYN